MSEMADAIRALSAEKGIDESSIRQTIERMILAAYQKSFGKGYDNCIVKFADDMSDVNVYARKTVVDGVYDPVIEIELEEAQKLAPEAVIHDTLDIPLDPKRDFERGAVSVGKQEAHKDLNENSSKKLLDEYKEKLGQIIIGYYQREHKGNIYVELGKVEGVLPVKYQSPREVYEKNDRIRALIKDVKKVPSGIQVVLSRTDENFVKSILELEVPEIQDNTIVVKSISREPGYRTKIAVASNKIDVDPVGACVGLKGVRIQNVIRELEGEKIDVLRYDEDPHVFIKNALSPAEVKHVVIKDAEKREALAVVSDENFSIAIGKQGLNVRLANRLCNWSIDVKTEAMVTDEDLVENDTRRAAEELFGGSENESYEEILTVAQLPGVDQRVAEILKEAGYDDIEVFVSSYESGALNGLDGVTKEQLDEVYSIINENVEFEDEEEPQQTADSAEEDSEEEYFCPECGEKITPDMTRCPKCGVEFSFEEE
ncbi:MAG: transcription termination factor NusA [Treponema succinifaciens]|uniref:transcription termination factor NusA n=1 Tax=Treponema TaxID=157 RepID=UPI002353E0B2|nr:MULTISPECIES: transcription termination factor NusA [Treponema]MDD6962781.1 transcription termination factor NusA [Treponema succinifaciens]MDY5116607.1 transcription termination factor NusA [Treponema succinifaciens]